MTQLWEVIFKSNAKARRTHTAIRCGFSSLDATTALHADGAVIVKVRSLGEYVGDWCALPQVA